MAFTICLPAAKSSDRSRKLWQCRAQYRQRRWSFRVGFFVVEELRAWRHTPCAVQSGVLQPGQPRQFRIASDGSGLAELRPHSGGVAVALDATGFEVSVLIP